jgi:hypothetical protein
MWAQGHKEYNAWSLLIYVAETIFLCPDARDLCILRVQGKLLVEEKMGAVIRSEPAHCLPTDWSGVPSAGRP